MVIHSREFSPRLCEVLGEDQLRIALSQAISKAEKYEFSLRGPIRLFIEASFLFGCGFDTDPQYPWAAEILGTDNSEMDRAERLCIEIVNYQEIVSGQEATNTRRALADLGRIRDEPPPPPASLSAEMELLFPEKTGYLGLDAIKALLNYATLVAGAYSLPPRGESVLALLMFSFGHHCADDPLYRWIRWTLEDTRITRPEARARRLEKKAITWLDHVIAANKRTTAP